MDSNGIAQIFHNNIQKSKKVQQHSSHDVKDNKKKIPSRVQLHQHKRNTANNKSKFTSLKNISLTDLEAHNKYLKNSYNFSAVNYKIKDYFHEYPVMPDLYKYYLQWLNGRVQDDVVRKHLRSKRELSSIILSLKDKMINANMRRAFRIPTYVTTGLQLLVKVCKKAQSNRKIANKYPSIKKLLGSLLSKPSFNKSSISLLLLLGLFKPDDNLRHYLLDKVSKGDVVYQKLLTSGYFTITTTSDYTYTTWSYPDNVIVLLNLAGLDMMNKYLAKLNKLSSDKLSQKLIESCHDMHNFRGGLFESVTSYVSNPISLVTYKLQDAMFMK